jgi:hypothetical protein
MLVPASPSVFHAHALPVSFTEDHAQPGNHVRIGTNPMLGLPVAPFVVYRAMTTEINSLKLRKAVVFTDPNGRVLTPGFRVTPEAPVTARIGLRPGEMCIWAELFADSTARDPDALVCEAFLDSARGPASIGSRSASRWSFSGPGIVELKIRGTGFVTGLRWIEASDPQPLNYSPLTVLNLPAASGARYLSVAQPLARAALRVAHQTPKRLPLQETSGAPRPSQAPTTTPLEEAKRVASLVRHVEADLDSLINDLATSPLDQTVTEEVFDEAGLSVGEMTSKRLNRVFSAQLDPGTASFLGYKFRDDSFDDGSRMLVFYRIAGFFQHLLPPKEQPRTVAEALFGRLLGEQSAEPAGWTRAELIERIMALTKPVPDVQMDTISAGVLLDRRNYFGVHAVAVADRDAPLDAVTPPDLIGAAHQSWVPELPPNARREVVVDCAGVRVAGLLAAGKRTPAAAAGTYSTLNTANDEGFHLPLMLGMDVTDPTATPAIHPGEGFLADRDADPGTVRYLLAQQDRFGRFSDWASIDAAPGLRPRPPRPQFYATATPPTVTAAATTGAAIAVRVMVPDREALAPGSHLLAQLRLVYTDLTTGTSITVDTDEAEKMPDADDPTSYHLLIERTGPVLAPCEARKVRITARWIDTADVASDESEAQTLTLHDPRPPVQVVVPPSLLYSARPDVTGLAWVEHRWEVAPTQAGFSVYYTDENRLKATLATLGEDALLTTLDALDDPAVRTDLYRSNAHLFGEQCFERLHGVVHEFASGQQGFRHAVSGSLRVLNVYRVVAESSIGAGGEFTELDLIVFGVPNSDPPAQPSLQVRPAADSDAGAPLAVQVDISVEPGLTPGATWRLRRAVVASSNTNAMPIVTTGEFDEVAPGVRQTATHLDSGGLAIAPAATLRAWARYFWVAEVQGAPEPGSVAAGTPAAGRWSTPSDPVSVILIPPEAPDPLTVNGVRTVPSGDGFTDVRVQCSHSESLAGGPLGGFAVQIARRDQPGAPLRTLTTVAVTGDGPWTLSVADPAAVGEVVAAGTQYLLQLIDPIGRISAPVTAEVS